MRTPSTLARLTPLTLLLALLPAEALAHPPGQARLPPVWTEPQCMNIVDRSVDPVVEIEYSVLEDEPPADENEPPDSGTFQFIAFCRDLDVISELPNWITWADVETAAEYNLVNPLGVDPELDVLDTHPGWAGCFARVTPDDARIPITAQNAEQPIVWDTSELEAGTYVFEGYTYEPWINAWTSHPGIFKIVDDPDPAASAPAAALQFKEQSTFIGGTVVLDGCVDAMPGSTMTLSWAGYPTTTLSLNVPTSEELVWQAIEADMPVENGGFAYEWTIAEELQGLTVLIKLDVVDPMGRSWTAHGLADIGVAGSVAGGESEDSGEEDPGLDEQGGEGCGCALPEHGAPAQLGWLCLALFGFGARSRRRAAHRRRASHT